MAFNNSEKREIESIIKKELKDFMGTATAKQFEDKLFDRIERDLRKGKLEGNVKEISLKMFRELYQFMWMNRSYWEGRLKNS